MNRLTPDLYDHLQGRFHKHRYNATQRGVPFELTFVEWLGIWLSSNRALERGTERGRFVMGRHGDTGPYAVGNVSVISHSENVSQARRGKPLSDSTKRKLSLKAKRRWRQWRAEQAEQRA